MKKDTKEAGLGKQFKEGGFREGLHSLPYKKITEAEEEICRMCYWTKATFTQKLSGRIAFRIYEIEQIEKYFATHNLNAWTGETLN